MNGLRPPTIPEPAVKDHAMTLTDANALACVFHFLTFEDGYESPKLAPFKATREAIHRHFRGKALEGSGEPVDPGELDALGRWMRQATGWGDLSRLN